MKRGFISIDGTVFNLEIALKVTVKVTLSQ
jgi:hypothetical protein